MFSIQPSLRLLAALGLLALALSACGNDTSSNPGGSIDTTTCKVNCNPKPVDTSCKVNCGFAPGPMGQPPYVAPRQSQIDSAVDSLYGHFGMIRIAAKGKSFLSGLKDSLMPYDHFAFPQHRVYFTYDFYMDKSEVEVAEFVRVMNWARRQGLVVVKTASDGISRYLANPDGGHWIVGIQSLGDNASSENIWLSYTDLYSHRSEFTMSGVSLSGARYYANLRSRMYDLEPVYDTITWKGDFRRNGFRLPTVTEFEYALRGGTTTNYTWGDKYISGLALNSGRTDTKNYPACTRGANKYRLCDMGAGEGEWLEGKRPDQAIREFQVDPLYLDGDPEYQATAPGLYFDSLWSRSGVHSYQPADGSEGFRLVLPIR
jgi:formylglycine-generating enzyme required for sulfatase activity